jgi:hypothetical protein
VAYGVAAGEVDAPVLDSMYLGLAVAAGPIEVAYIGDGDGFVNADRARDLVRAHNPACVVVMIVSEDRPLPADNRDHFVVYVKRPINWSAVNGVIESAREVAAHFVRTGGVTGLGFDNGGGRAPSGETGTGAAVRPGTSGGANRGAAPGGSGTNGGVS